MFPIMPPAIPSAKKVSCSRLKCCMCNRSFSVLGFGMYGFTIHENGFINHFEQWVVFK